MSLFSVDSKDVGLLAFVKRNALKRLLSETYPKTARKRDFAHPGLDPRRFVDAFFIVKRAKRKTDRCPISGGSLHGLYTGKHIICKEYFALSAFWTVRKDDDCFLRCFLLCLPKNFFSAGVTNIFLFQKSDRAKIRRRRRRGSHR